LPGQAFERAQEVVALRVQGAELPRQVVSVLRNLLDERVNFSRFLRAGMFIFREAALQSFGHESRPGEFLPQIIVQIKADSPSLVLRNFQQLIFQPPALLEQRLKLHVCRAQLRRPALHPRFQFLMGFPEILLRFSPGRACFRLAPIRARPRE